MKDILKYFINYCKNSSGQFSVETMDRLLDKGFVITNSDNEFKKPTKNLYLLGDVRAFQKVTETLPQGIFSERTQDNGFENNLIKLQTLLGNNYQTLEEGGLVELIDGNSSFMTYSLLFTLYKETFRLIQKGVVVNYDEQNNNIIISSVETFLKYNEASQPEIPLGLQYSILGELDGGGAQPA
jgi:hypothetical protein